MGKLITAVLGTSPITSLIGYALGIGTALYDYYTSGGKLTAISILSIAIMAIGRKAKDENK